MQEDWVLDVLTDLKTFAQQNGMFQFSEHLDDTLLVAAAELSAHGRRKGGAGQSENLRGTDKHLAGGKQSK